LAQTNKGALDLNGTSAVEDTGKHGYPLFGEGIGGRNRRPPRGAETFHIPNWKYQRRRLFRRQLKHEVFGKRSWFLCTALFGFPVVT
jgi:hypothetical protein